VLHRLRDVVEEAMSPASARHRCGGNVQVDLQYGRGRLVVARLDQAAAEPTHGRNVDLAGPHHLPERQSRSSAARPSVTAAS